MKSDTPLGNQTKHCIWFFKLIGKHIVLLKVLLGSSQMLSWNRFWKISTLTSSFLRWENWDVYDFHLSSVLPDYRVSLHGVLRSQLWAKSSFIGTGIYWAPTHCHLLISEFIPHSCFSPFDHCMDWCSTCPFSVFSSPALFSGIPVTSCLYTLILIARVHLMIPWLAYMVITALKALRWNSVS